MPNPDFTVFLLRNLHPMRQHHHLRTVELILNKKSLA